MIQASAHLHRQLDGLVVVPEYERRLRVLLEHCQRNLPSVDESLIRRAFRVAYWAHRDDRRASGELYISQTNGKAEAMVKTVKREVRGVRARISPEARGRWSEVATQTAAFTGWHNVYRAHGALGW